MEWAGFHKLRPGCVHVWCPKCKRKLSNMPRQTFDPPRAVMVHSWCDRCSQGCKDTPEYYFTARGKQIQWAETEKHIDAQIKAASPETAP